MRMSRDKHFSTSDLNLSAVLVANGFPLEYILKDDLSKATFYFLKSKQLDELIDKYWRLELVIEPHDLFNSLKALKNRMYSEN